MNDIFIDTNLAKNLANPLSNPYKQFIKWLFDSGYIVLNNKLHVEFIRGNQTLAVVIDRLIKEGRVNRLSNEDLRNFRFRKSEERKLLSNHEDRIHLKSVFLSYRKLALSNDVNFKSDVNNFRSIDGQKAICEDCPSKVLYDV